MDINRINTRLVPLEFKYLEPSTVEEAVRMLAENEGASILAGGTDLIIKMKQRAIGPSAVINIKRLSGLSYVREEADGLAIGAVTKLFEIEKSGLVATRAPALREGVSAIGSVQIRFMATLAGNLCNASPAADGSVALMALDSIVEAVGQRGHRSIPIDSFFVGPGRTSLDRGELLTKIFIPDQRDAVSAFARISRTDMDLAKVNVAVVIHLKGGAFSRARIALGAVAPTPIRARKAEDFLMGRKPSEEVVREAAEVASGETKPITDARSTAEYRRDIAEVLVRRALLAALARHGGPAA